MWKIFVGWVGIATSAALLAQIGCSPSRSDANSGDSPSAGGQPGDGQPTAGGGATSTGGASSGSGATAGTGGSSEPALPELQTAPLIFAPTASSFGVNLALGQGEPSRLGLQYRADGDPLWQDAGQGDALNEEVIEWLLTDLEAGTRYDYRVFAREYEMGAAGATSVAAEGVLYEGSAVTQRRPGESFQFALITDTHISPADVPPRSLSAYEYQESVLLQVAPRLQALEPDFIVNLGDMLDFHAFGFNAPPPSGYYTRIAYLNYRRCMLDALGNSAHFPVIGNWDGENGSFADDQIAYSRAERLSYLPGPSADTYPEGGSPEEDYYAYTWGDALFVVLNVMTYTEEELLLDGLSGSPEDWTLGPDQFAWLEKTLAAATSKWKFLMIHHAVGGAGGDLANAIYGRGGGLAANVGEQARVHDLMLQHGVQIFFYGHDHVFTDIVVDDIHYTLPGSAGAPWKFTQTETGYSEQWEDSGYASVRVTPDDVTVQFLSIAGEKLLEYTVD